jgi:hypothetical protein
MYDYVDCGMLGEKKGLNDKRSTKDLAFKVTEDNWSKYCYSVGDFNGIHWQDFIAQRFGLKNKIAPGMFVASHILSFKNPCSFKSVRFSDVVYANDNLSFDFGDDNNFFINKGLLEVGRLKGVGYELLGEGLVGLKEEEYKFRTKIEECNVRLYLESLGVDDFGIDDYFRNTNGGNNHDCLPQMYLASLSGPALLELGDESGFSGMHLSLSFSAYQNYANGPLDILIGDKRVIESNGRSLASYELRWVQKGEMVASGKSLILPFKN